MDYRRQNRASNVYIQNANRSSQQYWKTYYNNNRASKLSTDTELDDGDDNKETSSTRYTWLLPSTPPNVEREKMSFGFSFNARIRDERVSDMNVGKRGESKLIVIALKPWIAFSMLNHERTTRLKQHKLFFGVRVLVYWCVTHMVGMCTVCASKYAERM